EIDTRHQRAERGGVPLNLTPKEFLLLAHLARSVGEVVSRDEIAEHVWDIGFRTDTNVVDVVVRRLRAKVDDPFKTKLVHTIRGMGYVLKAPEPRSIASQLILLFTLAAALLLACGLGVFYWIVVRHAFAEDNAVLADRVNALQTSFEQRGGLDAVAAEINTTGSQQRAPFLVRVLDPSGATIGQTSGMETLLP